MKRLSLLVLAFACVAPGHWPPRPADHPPTGPELAFYELTAEAADSAERASFARELAARGFNVVNHPPYNRQLDVALTHEEPNLVATLRSDGWFVDEAVGPDMTQLASTLAVSQRVADFIRNSGLPQKHMMPAHQRRRRRAAHASGGAGPRVQAAGIGISVRSPFRDLDLDPRKNVPC